MRRRNLPERRRCADGSRQMVKRNLRLFGALVVFVACALIALVTPA